MQYSTILKLYKPQPGTDEYGKVRRSTKYNNSLKMLSATVQYGEVWGQQKTQTLQAPPSDESD